MSVRDRLVARDYLQVTLTEQGDVSVQTLQETVNCGLEMLKVLIHKA
jgi:hypothetical protein